MVAIANFGTTIVAPVLPTIQSYFGSSTAETAMIVSCFGFGRLAMNLPAGFLTDRVSPSRLFAAGILLSGVAAALAALSTNLQQLIVFRTAMGFSSAILSTAALVVLVNSTSPNHRGKALAFYTSAMLAGSAISRVIGGYLASLFSWRAVFVFCALTPLISFPLNLLFTNRFENKRAELPDHGKPVLKGKESRNRAQPRG